jgi:hypothetical protein
MADDWYTRSQAIIDQAEAERVAAGAPASPGAAPAPGGAVVPPDQQDWQQRAQTIIQKGQAGTLPSEAQMAGPPPGAAPYGALDTVMHGLTLGGSDLARGYMHDAARGVFGAPGGFEWGRSAKEIQDARDAYTAQHPYASFAGNAVGGALMPIPGVGAATKLVSQIPSTVGKIAGTLGLGSLVGGTTGAITGAADEAPRGAEAALAGAERGGAWGAGLGAIIPGISTAVTAGKRALESAIGPAPLRKLVGMDTTAADQGAAGRTMVREATDPARVQQIATQAEADPTTGVLLPGQEPGMPARPTIGQVTDDPGIRALEDKVYASIIKKNASDWTPAERELVTKSQLQSENRTAALRGEIDPLADPTAVQTPLQAQQRTLQTTQEAQTAAAQQRAADLATSQEAASTAAQQRLQSEQARLGRDLTAEERGAIIREEQAAGKVESKKGGVELNTALEATNAKTDQSATAAAAKDIRSKMLGNDKPMEGEELRLFDKAEMQGTAMPLAETLSLRSQITDEVRRVQRDPNADQRSVPRLVRLRQELDKTLEPHVAGMDDETGSLYRQRQDYWKQHAETYKNATTGDILQAGPNAGGYQMLPEQVATRILQNNSTAQAHLQAGGSQESLRGALVDDLYRFAKGKPLTEDMLTTWRNNRQGALRAAPGLADEVGNVGQAQRAIDDLVRTQKAETIAQTGEMTALAKAQKAETDAFESGAIGRVLKADPADVGPAISRILVRDDAASGMMQLKGQIAGNAPAEAGLKRAVISHIADEVINPQNGQIDPVKFQRLLNDKAAGPAIETAVGADGMKTLRAIAADQQRTAPGRPIMAGVNKGGTPSSYASLFRAVIEGQRGPGVDTLLAPTIAVASGGRSPGTTLATLATFGLQKVVQSARARGIEGPKEHLIEAVLNPAYGRAMMMKATPDNMPLAERAVQAALNVGRATPALTYDYGRAEQRQREDARRRLLEPVP